MPKKEVQKKGTSDLAIEGAATEIQGETGMGDESFAGKFAKFLRTTPLHVRNVLGRARRKEEAQAELKRRQGGGGPESLG